MILAETGNKGKIVKKYVNILLIAFVAITGCSLYAISWPWGKKDRSTATSAQSSSKPGFFTRKKEQAKNFYAESAVALNPRKVKRILSSEKDDGDRILDRSGDSDFYNKYGDIIEKKGLPSSSVNKPGFFTRKKEQAKKLYSKSAVSLNPGKVAEINRKRASDKGLYPKERDFLENNREAIDNRLTPDQREQIATIREKQGIGE